MIRELEDVQLCMAVLDGAVNKRLLSTGETREFASENVGFDLNPGVETATPQSLRSNWRNHRVRNNLRNVGNTGEDDANRCCQENWSFGLG
jgi:hypothetical protein